MDTPASDRDQDLEKSSSSSTFSEDQYNEETMDEHHERSTTPKIRAISTLKLAMSEMFPQNSNNESMSIQIPESDVVRGAIHFLGDLFCEFNDSISQNNSKTSRNSSNLSYKEHENEYIDAQKFVYFLEEKFSLFGYTTHEINQLFIELRPQTPAPAQLHSNNTGSAKNILYANNKLLSIHFTDFNTIIHQFYTAKFKEMLNGKSMFKQEDIHQLLLHSIKSKLQVSINDIVYNQIQAFPAITIRIELPM